MGQDKVVIVSGGVGGTFVANLLAKQNDRLEVTVVDAIGVHHYQPGLLYVPFG
jgi:sulfide:quinone oxidoreductase